MRRCTVARPRIPRHQVRQYLRHMERHQQRQREPSQYIYIRRTSGLPAGMPARLDLTVRHKMARIYVQVAVIFPRM